MFFETEKFLARGRKNPKKPFFVAAMPVDNPDRIWDVLFELLSSVEVAFKWHGLTPRWNRLSSIVVRVACSRRVRY